MWTTQDKFTSANTEFDAPSLELERQVLFGEPNVEALVDVFTKAFHRDAVVRLLQAIDRQARFYENMLEAIKSGSDPEAIIARYQDIGAIPQAALPGDRSVSAADAGLPKRVVAAISEKLERFARCSVKLVGRYGRELAAWVRPEFDTGTAVAVQTSLSWRPSVTVQLEFAGARS